MRMAHGSVGARVLLAACVAAAVVVAAHAYSCDSGVLQMNVPQDGDNCYNGPLSSNSIKAACLSAVRVRVKDGVVKIAPLVTDSFKYNDIGSSTDPTTLFNCKDMNASGLYFSGSTTSASVMLYDDFGGPLSNLTKTGANQITLTAAHSYSYTSDYIRNCQYNYTVVQGCVLGVQAPAKPPASCPVGSYKKTGRFGISYCAPCAPGTYSSKVGDACKPCPAGTYSSALGATKCTGKCEAGSFSRPGAAECTYCSIYENKWTDGKKCSACPKNSYGSNSNPTQCVKCLAGKKCCTVGWNKDCPKCTDGSAPAAYSSIFALESSTPSSCFTTGHALCAPKINITVDGSCSISVDNLYYRNNPDDNTYCSWSTFVAVQGLQFSISDLAKFDWFADNSSLLSGNFTAVSSPYVNVFIPDTKCTLRYRALTTPAATLLGAAPKPGKATTCPAGQYLESKTDAKPGPCLPCPPGHYSPRSSSGRNCFRCPAGTYAYGYGNKKCKKCPAGRASNKGAAQCTLCDLGSQPRPGGKGCVACPKDSDITYRGAGGQCLGNQYGTVCCASGNCKGQTPCKGPRASTSSEDSQVYIGVLQLVSKSLSQPACKNATFLSCLPANGKLQMYSYSSSPSTLSIQAYRTAFTCANYTNTYYGGYTSTKYAYVTSYEEAADDTVAFGLASDSAKGTVTMYLSPYAMYDYVAQVPAKASADCSATFKLVSGYAFDLKPPQGAKCDPTDSVLTYNGRQFCNACDPGSFKNSTGACQSCPAGSYSDTVGATACKPCPAGYSCYEGSSDPSPCVYGDYSSKPGQAECTQCPANTYGTESYDIPTTKCKTCPKGTISPKGALACGVAWDKAFPA